MTTENKVIAVIGATGGQGGGVLKALLDSKDGNSWHVRGITRDANSEKSQQILKENQTPDKRLSFVSARMDDVESLRAAFRGVYGVFAMTNQPISGEHLDKLEEMDHEIDAGRAIVQAAKDCGVAHFVFSSLPNMTKVTEGRFDKIKHMTNKWEIEQIARRELDGCTFVIPGYFYSNLQWPQYSRRQADGRLRFCPPISGDQVIQWTDSKYDVGIFTAKIFALGVEKTKGKIYHVLDERRTMDELAQTFTKVTGQPAYHEPISFEEWTNLTANPIGEAFRDDSKQMMLWSAMAPADKIAYGAADPEEDISAKELGLKASTFEDWLRRSGWQGPQEVYEPGKP